MRKTILSVFRANGYGLVILLTGVGFMSLGSESRQLINFYPLFVILVLMALEKMKELKPITVIAFAISSLILSRFWYTIATEGDISKNLLQYPAQRYFQFFGPWMSNDVYFMNLLIVIVAVVAFVIMQKTGNLFQLATVKPKIKQTVNKSRK
jgi:4-amino-4-deoxy-L-arabinose transferase-like glycosyltransferase